MKISDLVWERVGRADDPKSMSTDFTRHGYETTWFVFENHDGTYDLCESAARYDRDQTGLDALELACILVDCEPEEPTEKAQDGHER